MDFQADELMALFISLGSLAKSGHDWAYVEMQELAAYLGRLPGQEEHSY